MQSTDLDTRTLERKVQKIHCWLLCRSCWFRDSSSVPLLDGLCHLQVLRLASGHRLCALHKEYVPQLVQVCWGSRCQKRTLTTWCQTSIKEVVQEHVRSHWRSQTRVQQGQDVHREPGSSCCQGAPSKNGFLWVRALSQSWTKHSMRCNNENLGATYWRISHSWMRKSNWLQNSDVIIITVILFSSSVYSNLC